MNSEIKRILARAALSGSDVSTPESAFAVVCGLALDNIARAAERIDEAIPDRSVNNPVKDAAVRLLYRNRVVEIYAAISLVWDGVRLEARPSLYAMSPKLGRVSLYCYKNSNLAYVYSKATYHAEVVKIVGKRDYDDMVVSVYENSRAVIDELVRDAVEAAKSGINGAGDAMARCYDALLRIDESVANRFHWAVIREGNGKTLVKRVAFAFAVDAFRKVVSSLKFRIFDVSCSDTPRFATLHEFAGGDVYITVSRDSAFVMHVPSRDSAYIGNETADGLAHANTSFRVYGELDDDKFYPLLDEVVERTIEAKRELDDIVSQEAAVIKANADYIKRIEDAIDKMSGVWRSEFVPYGLVIRSDMSPDTIATNVIAYVTSEVGILCETLNSSRKFIGAVRNGFTSPFGCDVFGRYFGVADMRLIGGHPMPLIERIFIWERILKRDFAALADAVERIVSCMMSAAEEYRKITGQKPMRHDTWWHRPVWR